MLRLLILAAIGLPAAALAQDGYPTRPITMVVAFPPGGFGNASVIGDGGRL